MIPAAAELNNLGVTCLAAGDLRRALDLFRQALKFTMGEMEPEDQARAELEVERQNVSMPKLNVQQSSASADNKNMDTTEQSPMSLLASKVGPINAHLAKQAPPSSQFVHVRGINLVAAPTAYSQDTLVNTTIVSSIVIFNLAIVYHLKGLEECGNTDARLAKARSLYHKSHLLLQEAGVPGASTGNPVIDMLSMALFNNMAQSSFELGGYPESRGYFEQLICFATTVVPSRYQDAYVFSLLDQQKSNFLLNAIILHAPKIASAA